MIAQNGIIAGSKLGLDYSVWRNPGQDGKACASCHSPDGIELIRYGFNDKTIQRRAANHLSPTEIESVVGFLADQRLRNHHLILDSSTDRPLQPGGRPLVGLLPIERDAQFQAKITRLVPALTGKPIHSLAEAKLARDQILAVNVTELPVGIALNRISEDGFHGKEHASLANWIPDVTLPLNANVFASQDRYLANPTDDNLRELDRVTLQCVGAGQEPTDRLARAKYRSLLVLQHKFRTGHMVLLPRNPFWEVAEFGRLNADNSFQEMAVPPDIVEKKSAGPPIDQQLRELRLPWYWLGWMLDPGLQKSGGFRQTSRADYFTKTLWADGPYPAHALFMINRKQLEQGFNPKMWVLKSPQRFEIQYSFVLLGKGITEHEPPIGKNRTEFRQMAANSFRMSLWLLADSIHTSGMAYFPESQLLQVRLIADYLQQIHLITQADTKLIAITMSALKRANRQP